MSSTTPDQKPGSPPPAAPAAPAAMPPGPAAAGAEPDPLTRDSAPVSDLETRFSRAARLARKNKREADSLRTALADSETARAVCHRALDRSRQQPQLPNALVGFGAMTEAEALRREMQRMDADLRVMVQRDQAVLRGVGEFRRLKGEVGGLKRANAALTAKKTRYLRKARKYKTRLLARERAGKAAEEEEGDDRAEQEDAEVNMGMNDERAMIGAEDDSLFVAQDAADDDTLFVAQDGDDTTDPDAKAPACDAKPPAPQQTETATDTDADTAAKLATTATDELEAYKAELAATKALLEATKTELAEQQRETELYKYNAETYHEKLEAVRKAAA